MRVRTSRSADAFQAKATMPAMTATITAVFALQLCGCAYHPPDGDHTCLGYLYTCERLCRGSAEGRVGCLLDFSAAAALFICSLLADMGELGVGCTILQMPCAR